MPFYEEWVADYDLMTQFEARLESERELVHQFVEEYRIGKALDAGCGTGLHSILLAQLGAQVTGIDLSAAMLRQARENARRHGVWVRFLRSSFQEISRKTQGPFEAVFCLGNSLAHILSRKEMVRSLQAFAEVLQPGGVLILQNVNYDRILATKERVLGIKENAGKIFIRFYDFLAETIQFNVLILEKKNEQFTHKLISTELYPWRSEKLEEALEKSGFQLVALYGSLKREKFEPLGSKDIVIFAQSGK